jgi:hypothetical protein
MAGDRVAMVAEKLGPHLDVPILYLSETQVDPGPLRIWLCPG